MAVKRYIGGQWITVTGLQGPQGNTGLQGIQGPQGPAGVSAYYQASAPTSPNVGDVWIDSDEDVDVFSENIVRRQSFTATSAQTTFNTTNSFIQGYEQVFMNGVLLLRGTDYTTPTTSSIVLASGATAGDILDVIIVTYLASVSTYTQAEVNNLIDTKENSIPLQSTAPSSPSTSDLWVDNTNPLVPVLKVYNGSSWVVTGSQITAEDDQIILAGQIFG